MLKGHDALPQRLGLAHGLGRTLALPLPLKFSTHGALALALALDLCRMPCLFRNTLTRARALFCLTPALLGSLQRSVRFRRLLCLQCTFALLLNKGECVLSLRFDRILPRRF